MESIIGNVKGELEDAPVICSWAVYIAWYSVLPATLESSWTLGRGLRGVCVGHKNPLYLYTRIHTTHTQLHTYTSPEVWHVVHTFQPWHAVEEVAQGVGWGEQDMGHLAHNS